MTLGAEDFLGRSTFITGPGRASGKTSLVRHALALLRAAGERPAFLSVGFEGRQSGIPARTGGIACMPGEVFVSASSFLESSDCQPELLDVLPGSTALGRLAIVRARRAGLAVLVGPERNEYSALAAARIRGAGWARSILIDGAVNRITQTAALARGRFFFSLRAAAGELARSVAEMRRLYLLMNLPLAEDSPEPRRVIEGPLTGEVLARAGTEVKTIVVEDFTKVFIDGPALSALRRERSLAVNNRIDFGGFVLWLKDVSRDQFIEALDSDEILARTALNPFAAEEGPVPC